MIWIIKIIYGLGSSLSLKNNKQLTSLHPVKFSIDVNFTWFLEIRGNFIFQGYTAKAKQVAFENYGLTVVKGGLQWGDGFYG